MLCFHAAQTGKHLLWTQNVSKGPGKRGYVVADTNHVSTFARARICCGHKFCARNKCFPVCAAWKHNIHFVSRAFARPRNIMSNNVSAKMCPRFASTLNKIRNIFCVPDTKFVSAANVARAGKRRNICVGYNMCPQQCVLVCQSLKDYINELIN